MFDKEKNLLINKKKKIHHMHKIKVINSMIIYFELELSCLF